MAELKFNVNNDKKDNGNNNDFFRPANSGNQGRKLFQNKKANIALIIIGAVLVLGIIAAVVYLNIPTETLAG